MTEQTNSASLKAKYQRLRSWIVSDSVKTVTSAMLSVAAVTLLAPQANAETTNTRLVSTTVQDYCNPCDPCSPQYAPAPMGTVAPSETSTEVMSPSNNESESSAAFDSDDSFSPPASNPSSFSNATANSFAATSLASTTGSQGGLDAPSMLGDSPGYGATVTVVGVPYSLPTAGIRRFKVTENVSPIPQDRVFFNYNHFDDALQANATDNTYLDRYMFGGEKTFIDGLFSIEIRCVVSDGFDSQQTAARERGTEFGDLQFAFKSLLYSSNDLAIGGGLTLSVPTADDTELVGVGEIENETVFLAPFIGFVGKPTKNTFVQGFLQTDIVLGGDSVLDGVGVEQGIYQDQNLIYASLSAGHWLYRDECASACLNGIAGMVEFHYTSALNDADLVAFGGNTLTAQDNLDVLNLTSGLVVQTGKSYFRVGGSVPLTDDKFYDSEFQLQINRTF
ncbi:hypothetical protein SAMN06265222_12163 [Neorhodopirellula lusitana]|uniref:Secreted protein n=1 Tax=Neorhodopirellula lusitana TaxID=445327 RepID=A0ABY1QP77_9BACT|nr:hypothetical protein [Neorhodopirellula lusitana]SMP76521.1 hypothetical protein SAMN06265222_12163 [Neorhodopirellula lusitana]